ncbi:MAG: DUF805 domain-containing protein [Lachnospiraceae bacterium]|nr:DUF805 domain-containing protein [Lachnospiraceae bacterium]MBR1877103.1 DUF805 domain-containing protein [Lachnospiraceae bacterium]
MSFVDSIKTCFSKIVTFDGRARRSEYWWFQLFVFIVDIVVSAIINQTGLGATVSGIISLLLALCSLSVAVRRLHDIGKSGWFYLIGLIPLVGWIILIVWYCKDSEPGENQYGPNPKGM